MAFYINMIWVLFFFDVGCAERCFFGAFHSRWGQIFTGLSRLQGCKIFQDGSYSSATLSGYLYTTTLFFLSRHGVIHQNGHSDEKNIGAETSQDPWREVSWGQLPPLATELLQRLQQLQKDMEARMADGRRRRIVSLSWRIAEDSLTMLFF